MIDPFLQSALDSTIKSADRANKKFLPAGKAPGTEQTELQKLASLANARAAKARERAERFQKLGKLLDYYAGTSTPFERIAEHLKMKPDEVAAEMKARGRAS